MITISGGLAEPPPVIKAAYWPSWITTFPPSAINTTLFTHIFYAFLAPNNATYKLEITNSTAESLLNFTSTLRRSEPPPKTLFSIGGELAGRDLFAAVASQASSRKAFIDSSIEVARKFGFHGVDLDWEFPRSPKEMGHLGLLFNEWRDAIEKEAHLTSRPPLLLTAAVYFSADFFLAAEKRSYPVTLIKRNLDWINVMTYDYHGAWSNITGPNAALFDPTSDINSIRGLKSWINAGMPPSKIVMGLPLYGRTWKLKDPNSNRIGAEAVGPGPGDGAMTYSRVEKLIEDFGARVEYDVATVSVYVVLGSTWIGYDDGLTITTKIGFAQALGLRGYFFWALGYDRHWEISTQGIIIPSLSNEQTNLPKSIRLEKAYKLISSKKNKKI
ncbi:hypothetical protein UlMin_002869 [Ulmus minor]